MRRHGVDRLALPRGLPHQGKVAHSQVTKAAVNELGGAAGGARGEVLAVDERDA